MPSNEEVISKKPLERFPPLNPVCEVMNIDGVTLLPWNHNVRGKLWPWSKLQFSNAKELALHINTYGENSMVFIDGRRSNTAIGEVYDRESGDVYDLLSELAKKNHQIIAGDWMSEFGDHTLKQYNEELFSKTLIFGSGYGVIGIILFKFLRFFSELPSHKNVNFRMNRRDFLKLAGASLASAGLAYSVLTAVQEQRAYDTTVNILNCRKFPDNTDPYFGDMLPRNVINHRKMMNMQKRLGSEASMFEVWGNSHFHPEILSTLRQKNIDITAFVRQILRREYDFLKENGKDDENALERVVELHVNMARADILKPNREGEKIVLDYYPGLDTPWYYDSEILPQSQNRPIQSITEAQETAKQQLHSIINV